MKYDQHLQRLLNINLQGGVKLGLENCLKLNAALGNPVDDFSVIHVAGTNGKGSVSTKIAKALQADGQKVGLYTSPHIACFRERICINQEMISEEQVETHLSQLFLLTEQLKIPATFFELTTLMAFAHFAKSQVDIAVIETGLGGRLDATNIVHPMLTIITSISLDHTEILGHTIEEIAREKCGILKPHIPLITGPRTPVEIIRKAAAEKECSLTIVKGIFDNFHDENKAIAANALRHLLVSEDAIAQGLDATPPCRQEIWDRKALINMFPIIPLPQAVICDVAHNPDGIAHLISSLKRQFPNTSYRFILGLSKSKDIAACLSLIKNEAAHIHLVEAGSRAATKKSMHDTLNALGFNQPKITEESSIAGAISDAIEKAGRKASEIVVVCGTFFIMAEARAALGVKEPQDPSSLN